MKSRILLKTENQMVLDEGDGYRLRAIAMIVGTFSVIAIDWEHPNYGYFADGMLCFRALHVGNWDAIPITSWCWKYKSEEGKWDSKFLLDKFLEDYPEFKEFFDMKTIIWDNLSLWEIPEK